MLVFLFLIVMSTSPKLILKAENMTPTFDILSAPNAAAMVLILLKKH